MSGLIIPTTPILIWADFANLSPSCRRGLASRIIGWGITILEPSGSWKAGSTRRSSNSSKTTLNFFDFFNWRFNNLNPEAVIIIEKFESIVIEQLATSGDSLEDWNDLVPEEIAALKSQVNAQGPRDLQS